MRASRFVSAAVSLAAVVVAACFLNACLLAVPAEAQQEPTGSEFVDEILQEEKEHYGERHYDDPYYDDADREAEYQRKVEEQERLLAEEEERIARQRAEQRERAFQQELSRMDEDQRKAAQKQKKRDSKIVKRVLRAAEKGDLYASLGLSYREIVIPSRSIGVGALSISIPGFRVMHIPSKSIRKAYRKMSMLVHPDRNRDGRAEEAFIALENAAAILSDEARRAEYDDQLRAARRKRRHDAMQVVVKAMDGVARTTGRTVAVFRKVLGPFAFPVLVIGSLLV